jgi:hypothetical protein
MIAKLRAGGATSIRQIAAGLNAAEILTPRGHGEWSAVQVQRVLKATTARNKPPAGSGIHSSPRMPSGRSIPNCSPHTATQGRVQQSSQRRRSNKRQIHQGLKPNGFVFAA